MLSAHGASAPARPAALLHYSEDPGIERFVPHVPGHEPGRSRRMVWTIDELARAAVLVPP